MPGGPTASAHRPPGERVDRKEQTPADWSLAIGGCVVGQWLWPGSGHRLPRGDPKGGTPTQARNGVPGDDRAAQPNAGNVISVDRSPDPKDGCTQGIAETIPRQATINQ
jgi:hypothetical protein